MISENVWIRLGLKVLLTGLIFITAVSIAFQGALKLTKAAFHAGVDATGPHRTAANAKVSMRGD